MMVLISVLGDNKLEYLSYKAKDKLTSGNTPTFR